MGQLGKTSEARRFELHTGGYSRPRMGFKQLSEIIRNQILKWLEGNETGRTETVDSTPPQEMTKWWRENRFRRHIYEVKLTGKKGDKRNKSHAKAKQAFQVPWPPSRLGGDIYDEWWELKHVYSSNSGIKDKWSVWEARFCVNFETSFNLYFLMFIFKLHI